MTERIVIIDDSANDLAVARRFLERRGFAVHSANSGEEGLQLARQVSPDAIVVDYRMPKMNGFEVARAVKSDPLLRTIPVLVLTGADSSERVVEGLDAGADDFVTKGSDLEVLFARIRALLRVKAYQDQLRRMNQQMTRDLQIARRVQEALVPAGPFTARNVEVRSAYIPSETLSGDFYDYFSIGDATFIFLADVSGHGLPAAILVALLKSYLHTEVTAESALTDFMTGLNDFLFTVSLPAQYATALLLRIDAAGRLSFANAAHPAFLVVRAESRHAEIVEWPSNLLGAIPEMSFEEHTIDVRPGDTLFAYTDGLTDRRTADGDFYTVERVAAILEEHCEDDLATLYAQVFEDVTSFQATEEFRDDIAFVIARFR